MNSLQALEDRISEAPSGLADCLEAVFFSYPGENLNFILLGFLSKCFIVQEGDSLLI